MNQNQQSTPEKSLSPAERAETFFQRGWQFTTMQNYDQAMVEFNRVLELNPYHFAALNNLAACLTLTSRTELALKTYQSALKSYPQQWEILSGIANCHCQLGDFDQGVKYYKKAIRFNPDNRLLTYNLGLIYRYAPHSPIIQDLIKSYGANRGDAESRMLMGFTLARMYENQGEHRSAFQYYEESNRIQFNLSGYKAKEREFLSIFDDIKSIFNASYFAGHTNAGILDTTPVFVIGMPRSGTSLVEQILASHPSVHGAGETNHLHSLITKNSSSANHPFLRPAPVMENAQFKEMANLYLLRLRHYAPAHSLHIVDKTPQNFLLIGMIHLMFPRAKIIHCVRDPMDTCWSMYRQHFSSGFHPYCYDQVALGTTYRHYQKLMQHWHQVLPGEIYDVHYEQLLAQPEVIIRNLIEHCHLPWDEKCLSFHKTNRIVNTASMSQVRQPLYKSSLRSWEGLTHELTPLQAALGL